MQKIYYLLFLSIIFYCSCKNAITQLPEKVNNADSIAINYFKGDGSMDSVIAVKIIRDKDKINQLAEMIGGSTTDEFKCGSDGSIHFFKNNMVIQDVAFRMNDVQCMHFSFTLDGAFYSTELKPESKQLLESFKK